ncbi:MAG TPA: hypothetical protein VJ813_05770 [Vicinamibacterales bacterium]|nr:hypothetical protein [Vicinamibacterales bacterium]
MFAARQNRVRVLQAIEQAVQQFRTREALWPLRVPNAPLSLDDLAARTLAARRFDPLCLRARTLLWLQWDAGDTWDLWILALPSGLKLYCDTGGGETRMLATGRRDSEIDTDRLFLELLSESAGEHFGIEMAGGPPSKVRSPLEDRALVVDFFVNLFEVLGMEEEIRRITAGRHEDFRADVAQWLTRAGFTPTAAAP